jgi:hypothetical protein
MSNPRFTPPAGSTEFQETSWKQGGRGVALRQNNTLGAAATPLKIGQSPSPGTSCTCFLSTLKDPAYIGAQVDFIVMQFGRESIFSSVILDAGLVDSQAAIEITAGTCAADYWEVQLTNNSGLVPAQPLQSSILATGVENQSGESDTAFPPFEVLATGPSATGFATFDVPIGTTLYSVTGVARVVHAGGASEAVGDSYVTSQDVAWNVNAAGTVARLIPTPVALSVIDDASMSGTTFVAGVDGSEAKVTYALPAGLDAGTTVQVTITLALQGLA